MAVFLLFALLRVGIGSAVDDEAMEKWFIEAFSPPPFVTGIAWPGDGLPLESLGSDASIMCGILRRDGSIPFQVLLDRLGGVNPDSQLTSTEVENHMQKLMWSISVSAPFHNRLNLIVKARRLNPDSPEFRTAIYMSFQREYSDIPRVAIQSVASDWVRFCILNPDPSSCYPVMYHTEERWVLSTSSILSLLRDKEKAKIFPTDQDRIYNTVRFLVAGALQSKRDLNLIQHVNAQLIEPVSADLIRHVRNELMNPVSIKVEVHQKLMTLTPLSVPAGISPELAGLWFKYCIEPLRQQLKQKPCIVIPAAGLVRLSSPQVRRYMRSEETRIQHLLEIP